MKRVLATWLSLAALFVFVASVEPARDFDGATDRIDWAAPFVLGTGQAMTISMWAFHDDCASNSDYLFDIHVSGDASHAIIFYCNPIVSPPTNDFYSVTITGSTANFRRGANATVTTGSWVHLAVTWDGTFTDFTTIHIYKNGTEISYDDAAGVNGNTQNAPTGSWSVGGRISDDLRNFDGKIAEPAFFTRVLTDVEIGLLSGTNPTQAPLSPNCLTSGPAWYPINGLGGETPNDEITGTAATLDGTTVIAHPSIRYCMAPFTFDIAPAVPPAGGVGHLGGAHLGRAKTGGAHIP
jgi:hypothetical protein